MKKRYIQLKDDSAVSERAIWEEKCDGGSQDFTLITLEHDKFPDGRPYIRTRDAIMKNPTWFEEIEEAIWLTKDQVKQVKKLFKIK